jgi:hypothetical protein
MANGNRDRHRQAQPDIMTTAARCWWARIFDKCRRVTVGALPCTNNLQEQAVARGVATGRVR